MPHPYRRSTFGDIIQRGDISVALLLAGLGLIIGSGLATFYYHTELNFPFSDVGLWLANCLITGLALWWVTIYKLPPLRSLLVGAWISVLWTWHIFHYVNQHEIFLPVSKPTLMPHS